MTRNFPHHLTTPVVLCLALAATATATQAQPAKEARRVTVAVVMGLKDKEATVWEGKLTANNCEVLETDGWRFTGDDYVTRAEYRVKTRPFVARFATRNANFDITKAPINPNGIVLSLATSGPNPNLKITTPKGEIDIPLGAFGYGPARKVLEGNAEVRRIPNYSAVVRTPKEDSYPAAARGKDGLVASFIAMAHGPGFDSPFKLPGEAARGGKGKGKKAGGEATPAPEGPESFDFLTAPCGGDQVVFVAQTDGAWGQPEPVTETGQRVLGTAVAVDGDGRAWVFWSARDGDNWDIFARARSAGKWSSPIRVSGAKGSDVFPTATTDAKGRAWVAWQSLGDSSADILAATQQGEGFAAPEVVSATDANEWEPAIAASADGQVAIAWDTYGAGNYDVKVRVWAGSAWGEPQAVTRSLEGEARPSLAFDARNRLWVAYEVAPENWGKDFGPYDYAPNRTALYQNRSVGLRVLEGSRWLAPGPQPAEAFPATRAKPGAGVMVDDQDRRLVAHPRIAIAEDGRVWLSARAKVARFEAGTGDTWIEYLTCLDGEKWRPAIPAIGSDAYLHQAAALLPALKSGVAMLAVSDGRFRAAARMNLPPIYTRRSPDTPPPTTREYPEYPDPTFNQDIYLIETGSVSRPDAEPKLAESAPAPAPDAPELAAEAAHVKAIREYRAEIGGKSLRIARGEFHRHTELSGDGGNDGSLFDMWRYAMDMADLDWIGIGDHDNGTREFPWWISQKTTHAYLIPGTFFPVWSYERSNNYPDGHRNAVFAREGIRPLPRLRGGLGKIMDELAPDAQRPNSPDSLMFFRYLEAFGGICASHTSATDMGTDWRDFGGKVEPVVEIYQGDRNSYERPGAPRASSDQFSLGGFRPLGFVSLALKKGFRMGFQASSDHLSTHMSYCLVYVDAPTRESVVEGMRNRRVYGATDNIIADVRCGDHFMGEEFTTDKPPTLRIKLVGTAPFAEVVIVKDDEVVYSSKPEKQAVEFEWTDAQATPGKTSYYYVRGTQQGDTTTRKAKSPTGETVEIPIHNGEVVWVSPMWITMK